MSGFVDWVFGTLKPKYTVTTSRSKGQNIMDEFALNDSDDHKPPARKVSNIGGSQPKLLKKAVDDANGATAGKKIISLDRS